MTAQETSDASAKVEVSSTTVKQPKFRLFVGPVTANNVNQLRLLNTTLFPVRYDKKFYADCVQNGETICQMGYFNDICVASICCRYQKQEPQEQVDSVDALYIMTLGVLAPYKRLGLGRKMLQHLLTNCTPKQRVFLHMSTVNTDARAFYEHCNFKVVETLPGYYKRNVLNDGGDGSAWLLEYIVPLDATV